LSFLPEARRLTGKKLLVGDNLASHISLDVIRICRKNNIEFVCPPPNSMDKLQPLDVGVFGPMKYTWRRMLRAYGDKDPSVKLLVKPHFPKELVASLKPQDLLPGAFQKCGLYPLDRSKVLEFIPSTISAQQVASHVDSALSQRLEARRFGEAKKKQPRGMKIPAGQSYTHVNSEEEETSEDKDDVENLLESGVEEIGVEEIGVEWSRVMWRRMRKLSAQG
jgi:hypothetical protein